MFTGRGDFPYKIPEIGGGNPEKSAEIILSFFKQFQESMKRYEGGSRLVYNTLVMLFIQLDKYIEQTDYGSRLKNKLIEQDGFIDHELQVENLFDILKNASIIHEVGQNPGGVFQKTWGINTKYYLQVRDLIAEKVRDFYYEPADQKKTADIVANYFGITTEQILNASKSDMKKLYYRQILAYLIYKNSGWKEDRQKNGRQDFWGDKKEQVSRDKRVIENLLDNGDTETAGHIKALKTTMAAHA